MCRENGDILFITLSNIGDAIMTTPVLQSLMHVYPGSAIDVVSDRRSAQIFQHCPGLGKLFLKNKRAGILENLRFLHDLRKKKYRLIVDLRTDGLSWLLRAGKRLTKGNADRQKVHAVEQHLSVIDCLDRDRIIPEVTLWLDKTHDMYAKSLLESLPGKNWLAIGPGCGGPEKVWPGERYRELANREQGLFDAIILVGGTGDTGYADRVVDGLNVPHLNLCGKTDLLQAAAVLKRARLFIGSDSGLGHIASAVSTPTVTLFGVGSPERYRPWGDRAVWLRGAENEIRNIQVEDVISCLCLHMEKTDY